MTNNIEHLNYNIIAFGGRKESGKTELANMCTKYGYEKISFAKPLKMLICKLLKLDSIEALNEAKNKEIGYVPEYDDYYTMSKETGLPLDYCEDFADSFKPFHTVRDWLQIIGTDIIRNYDPDWHVKRTMALIENDKKYVFDDVRFPNELSALKNINAECWFVIRPKIDNISHHISEEALDMTMFDGNIIVNDGPLQKMIIHWDIYMNTHIETWGFRQKVLDNFESAMIDMEERSEDYSKYFLYGRINELPEVKESIDKLMESHSIIPCQNNSQLAVVYKNTVCYIETDPFRIEFMKKYYRYVNVKERV